MKCLGKIRALCNQKYIIAGLLEHKFYFKCEPLPEKFSSRFLARVGRSDKDCRVQQLQKIGKRHRKHYSK